MVDYLDLHPWLVAAFGPFVIAAALLLASIPRRLANWRMRRSELLLEISDLEARYQDQRSEIAIEHVQRIRQLDEQRRVAGVLSPGLRAAALAKIEPGFRRRQEQVERERKLEVSRRVHLLNASRFAKLFSDDCQHR